MLTGQPSKLYYSTNPVPSLHMRHTVSQSPSTGRMERYEETMQRSEKKLSGHQRGSFYIFSSIKIKPADSVASLIDTETLKEGHRTISTQTVQWYRYFSCRDNETLYIEINNLRNAPRRTQQNLLFLLNH